jgi:hypothetical protein
MLRMGEPTLRNTLCRLSMKKSLWACRCLDAGSTQVQNFGPLPKRCGGRLPNLVARGEGCGGVCGGERWCSRAVFVSATVRFDLYVSFLSVCPYLRLSLLLVLLPAFFSFPGEFLVELDSRSKWVLSRTKKKKRDKKTKARCDEVSG